MRRWRKDLASQAKKPKQRQVRRNRVGLGAKAAGWDGQW